MTDEELLALNIYEEAGGEIDDGKAAVARITLNRMRHRFFSDGTMSGTVLAKDQFSWAYFGFVSRHTGNANVKKFKQEYVRLCHSPAEAKARAEALLKTTLPRTMGICRQIGADVMAGTYKGALYRNVTDDTVSYLNPRILTRLPKWATPDRFVCTIGHHDFYRAEPLPKKTQNLS